MASIVGGALGGITSGVASYAQAKSQGEYQSAVQKAQRKAVGVQNVQLSDAAALERLKSHNEANLIRSRLRVAAGESGIGFGGTYEALVRQADYDEGMNKEIIGRNLMNSIAMSNSQLMPGAPVVNPLFAMGMGMMSGAVSGMSIGNSISNMGRKPEPASGTNYSAGRAQ